LAIALNPKRNTNAIKDAQADSFISGAGKAPVAVVDEADESGRKPVVIRIPADLLKRIDLAAKKKAISRSSFIVSSLADLVNGER
jgi:DUF1009 family protein